MSLVSFCICSIGFSDLSAAMLSSDWEASSGFQWPLPSCCFLRPSCLCFSYSLPSSSVPENSVSDCSYTYSGYVGGKGRRAGVRFGAWGWLSSAGRHTDVGLLDRCGAGNCEGSQLGLSTDSGNGGNWLGGSDEERHDVCVCVELLFVFCSVEVKGEAVGIKARLGIMGLLV